MPDLANNEGLPTGAPGPHGVLDAKYAVLLAYIAYGDQLSFPTRDGLYQHFSTHADEERKWIYELHRHCAANRTAHFGGFVVNPCELTSPEGPLQELLYLESCVLDAWKAWDQQLKASGDNLALSGFIQDGARATLTHLEDLRRYLGGTV